MRVMVTGAAGFLGKWMCHELRQHGHEVVGAVRVMRDVETLTPTWSDDLAGIRWIEMDVTDPTSVDSALEESPDAVIHLAAIASGAQAREDPMRAWLVNCVGTARLAYAIERVRAPVRLVFASTGEVYGAGLTSPATEEHEVAPCSPYAASKAAAELAVLEVARRAGLDAVIARAFAQAGPGQRENYVLSAFVKRILRATADGATEVPVGNLAPVREFVDVRDAVTALRVLMESGAPGEVYNIAAGNGVPLARVFERIGAAIGWRGSGVPDPALFRQGDIPYLVGDGAKLARLGWTPRFRFEQTIADVVREARARA